MPPVDFDLEFDEIYVMKVQDQPKPTPPPEDDTDDNEIIIFNESSPVKDADKTLIVF